MTAVTEGLLEAQIRQACRQLRLPTIAARAAGLSAEATKAGEGQLSFLAALLEAELEDRTERRRHRRIAEAHFPRLKRLEDFRFEEAPQIPAATIRELAGLGFVDRAEPLIFVGDSGTPVTLRTPFVEVDQQVQSLPKTVGIAGFSVDEDQPPGGHRHDLDRMTRLSSGP